MRIVHGSAECYPMAKAGGLGDVVGALPKYQQKIGLQAMVVMPMYKTKFLEQREWEVHFKGNTNTFHSPLNSFINTVLETRKGNPLSLSLIYSIIAQNLNIPI